MVSVTHHRRVRPTGATAAPASRLRPAESRLTIGFGLWMIAGLFLDGWAHSNQKPDSFFTPWHGVLYSGFTAATAFGALAVWRRHQQGRPWREAVPTGHGYSIIGIALFASGAFGDLLWHQAFGVEVSAEALLSPTHLLLMIGGILAMTGPLRAAWTETGVAPPLSELAPAIASVALVGALAMFFTMYASPFGTDVARFASVRTDIHDLSTATPEAFAQLRETSLLTGILLATVLLITPALLLLRRWRLPAGSLTLMFTLLASSAAALGELERPLLVTGVLAAGIAGDLLVARSAPLLLIAGVLPAVVWTGYFAGVQLQYGMRWTAPMWTGAIVLSALLGSALSLLVCDPSRQES